GGDAAGGPAVGEREGGGECVDGVPATGGAGTEGPGGRGRVAQGARVGGRGADRAVGALVRRVHDRVRADALGGVRGGDRGGAGDGLAGVRHDLHRAVHGDAVGEPGGVRPLVGGEGGEGAEGAAADRARGAGRQRAPVEHVEAGAGAAAGEQAVRPGDLSGEPARDRRGAVPAADVRVHSEDDAAGGIAGG